MGWLDRVPGGRCRASTRTTDVNTFRRDADLQGIGFANLPSAFLRDERSGNSAHAEDGRRTKLIDRRRHDLKCWPEYFEAIERGDKTFEIRNNDRDYQVGDLLMLLKWNPETSDWCDDFEPIYADVIYVLDGGQFGLEESYVAMGIRVTRSGLISHSKLKEAKDAHEAHLDRLDKLIDNLEGIADGITPNENQFD